MADGQIDRKIAFIIQARMKSTRLPGKILLPIPIPDGKPLLNWIVEELKKSSIDHQIIVATSVNEENDSIEEFCVKNEIKCYRGEENDVLSRFLSILSTEAYHTVVRLTADNPIIDLTILEETIKYHIAQGNDYTNTEGLPIGMNFEIVKGNALQDLKNNVLSLEDKEHVTLHLKNNPKYKKGIYQPNIEPFFKNLRLTVDYASDFALMSIVLSNYTRTCSGMLLIKKIYKEYPWLFLANDQNIQKKQYQTVEEEISAAYQLLNSFDLKRAANILQSNRN